MSNGEVPEDLRDFLYEHIESYEALAVLLLLHAHPSRVWDAETVARDVRIPYEAATQALGELCDKGLATPAPSSSFAYAAGSQSSLVARIAALYEAQPLDIMRLMNANAIHRLRTSMIKSFSNAFLVGRKKKDG